MAKTLDWNSSEDTRDIVHIVVQALVEGRKVVLPADRAYHLFASGLKLNHTASLLSLRSSGIIGSCTLVLRSAQELMDYCTELSPIAARMAQRGWPGPMVLDLPVTDDRSLFNSLPCEVCSLVSKDNRALFRVVAHPSAQHSLRLMSGPLVAAPILQDGDSVVRSFKAGELADASIVVDDRQIVHGELPTVIRIDGNQCHISQPGALPEESLNRFAQFIVLLVCTGNTCRSPMAETILRDKFTRRFLNDTQRNCPFFVASGGISAYPGGPASAEAQSVMSARGLSLEDHQSRAVTKHDLQLADLVLVMTKSHREALLDNLPEIKHKVHLLSGTSTDVSDPFGGPESLYAACASQMNQYLDQWMPRLPDSLFPVWR